MNLNKLIWYGALAVFSANLAVFISSLAIQFPALRIAYILLAIAMGWFVKSHFSEGFRQAIADSLNLDEGELIIILFCILTGALIGGVGTWIKTIL
ncbi:MAG: hypothetical protein AAGA80_05320 [Cyanobacteria bacterium P01_F01_bin.143]